jgi:hypothetical protein
MRIDFEALRPGQSGEGLVELALEIVGEVNVGHGAAHLAREVMVVPDERLGELEPGEVADAGHAPDHAFGFEHGEIAVDAARALAWRPDHDLVDRERTPGLGEHLDQVTAGACVPAGPVGETSGDGLVQDDALVRVRSHALSVVAK